jgi:hypothetical protein
MIFPIVPYNMYFLLKNNTIRTINTPIIKDQVPTVNPKVFNSPKFSTSHADTPR